MVRTLITASVPAEIVGSLVAVLAPEELRKIVLAVGLGEIALVFTRHHDPEQEDAEIQAGVGIVDPVFANHILPADGAIYDYEVCRPTE